MNDLLTNILHMSLTGSIVIIVVLIARLMMKRLPKKYMYLLWGIVGFRLLCPITFESSISIFNIKPIRNSVENVRDIPLVQYGPGHTDSAANVTRSVKAAAASTEMHLNIAPFILIALWAAIAVGIISFIIYKYVAIKHDLKTTTEVKPGLFVGHQVDSPFVMGIVRPKIYMPAGLTDSELEYLTLHEKTHIRRGDTFFKAIGILTLALHWFNPLVWVAYILFVRDMEMSCDEEVIRKLGNDVKADYSMSLVSFAQRSNRSRYIVVPIAFSRMLFGRKDVKMRIKNVLGYHATSKLISTLALALVASISLVCLFNATSRADEDENNEAVILPSEGTIAVADASTPDDTEEGEDDLGYNIEGNELGIVTSSSDEEIQVILSDELQNEFGCQVDAYAAGAPDSEPVTDPAEAADPAASAAITENNNNILDTALPVFDGVNVNFIINAPKGTSADAEPELGRVLIDGTKLESDSFSTYYSQGVSQQVFNEMVDTLKTKYGFTAETDSYHSFHFTGVNSSSNIGVTVEQLDNNYLRISYYRMTDEVNSFARVG